MRRQSLCFGLLLILVAGLLPPFFVPEAEAVAPGDILPLGTMATGDLSDTNPTDHYGILITNYRENFPIVPVDVRFKMTQPAEIPFP